MKVSKDTWTLLKGMRHGSFYVLQDSTVAGSLITCTSAPSDIFTYLYYMWSNYMRKQDFAKSSSIAKSSSVAKFKYPLNSTSVQFAK